MATEVLAPTAPAAEPPSAPTRSLSGRVHMDLDWMDGFQAVVALELRTNNLRRQLADFRDRRTALRIAGQNDDERFLEDALTQSERSLRLFHEALGTGPTESENRALWGDR